MGTDAYGNTITAQGQCMHDGERVHHDNGGQTCTGCGTRFGWPVPTVDVLARVLTGRGIAATVENTGGGVMAVVVKAPQGEVVVTPGSTMDETTGYAVVTMARDGEEPEAHDTAGWGDMVDYVERCSDALTPVTFALPTVHAMDDDGLTVCATGEGDPTITADDERITCTVCADALGTVVTLRAGL